MKSLIKFCFPACDSSNVTKNIEISNIDENIPSKFDTSGKKGQFVITDEEKILNSSTKFNDYKTTSKEKDINNISPDNPIKGQKKTLSLIESSIMGGSSKNLAQITFQSKNISFKNTNTNKEENDSNLSKDKFNPDSSSASDSLINFSQRINIEIEQKFPDIIIEEKEGTLLNGKKLVINPSGLSSSPRKIKDGFVYFGEHFENEKNEIDNDVELTLSNFEKSEIPEHYFVIYFKLSTKKYYIRPYSNNAMSFLIIRLNSSYKLHNKECLVFTDFVLMINIEKSDNTLIITKISSKENEEESVYRYKPDFGIISLGRDKNCTISFTKNKMLSKVHTTIHYCNESNGWLISDGGDLPSLNGTWLMPRHSYEINDGLQFKTGGKSKFVIRLFYKC